MANLNKVTKTIIAELMLSDMKDKPDKSHDGNQNKVSNQHYSGKVIDKVLKSFDNISKCDIFSAPAASFY